MTKTVYVSICIFSSRHSLRYCFYGVLNSSFELILNVGVLFEIIKRVFFVCPFEECEAICSDRFNHYSKSPNCGRRIRLG